MGVKPFILYFPPFAHHPKLPPIGYCMFITGFRTYINTLQHPCNLVVKIHRQKKNKQLNFLQMRQIVVILMFAAISQLSANAQSLQGEKVATHFYIVNLDEGLQKFFSSEKTDRSKFTEITLDNKIIANIIDTFYTIATNKLKDDLGLNLLPLKELQNKIKYNSEYPNCPETANIKKVLKSVSGYTYYTDFYVNVYSDFSENMEALSPDKIKPLYAISFTLYDAKGNSIEKTDFSFRSKETLTKDSIQDKNKIKMNLCKYYYEALNGLSIACKKKFVAEL
jgi:hypothetical protein